MFHLTLPLDTSAFHFFILLTSVFDFITTEVFNCSFMSIYYIVIHILCDFGFNHSF